MTPADIGLRSDPHRSRIMRAVRRKGTTPEVRVREALRRLGVRFRPNVADLPGSPDLANKRRRLVIFVHGCFWHRHRGCSRTTDPKRNVEFWEAKFDANRRRDRRKYGQLRRLGYRVLIVWECETRDTAALDRRLRRALERIGEVPVPPRPR